MYGNAVAVVMSLTSKAPFEDRVAFAFATPWILLPLPRCSLRLHN